MRKRIRFMLLLALSAVLLCVGAAAMELPEEARYGRVAIGSLENGESLVLAYDQLARSVEDWAAEAPIGSGEHPLTKEDAQLVMEVYRKDHPEIFWLSDAYSYYPPQDGVVRLLPEYTMPQAQAEAAAAELEAAAEELLAGIHEGMSEVERQMRIHDRLCDHITYALDAENQHDIYGALVRGRAVCDGYTEAYQYLLGKVGIQAYSVSGLGNGGNHAWNLLRLDGTYYYADVTWDDGDEETYHAWCNITTRMLEEDHEIVASRNRAPLPECNSLEANYFVLNGGWLEEVTVEGVAELLRLSGGEAVVYAAMEDYADVGDWYFAHAMEIAEELGIYGSISYGCSYSGREYHLSMSGLEKPEEPDIPDGPAHVHVWDGGAVTRRPTCTQPGEEAYTCECGETRLESIPALGHTYSDALDADCDRCGQVREVEGAEKPAVSGTVSGGAGATVEIGGQRVEVKADGTFVLPAEGTFDVVIRKAGCLTVTVRGVTMENGEVDLGEIVLVAGDVNGDNKINISDMGAFRQEFGKTGENITNALTDVNGDGKVNIADMGIFRQNFGKTAEKDCTIQYA